MNIGIYDLTHCSNLNYVERIKIYQRVGFKELALYLDNKYMQGDENYLDIINFARKSNLKIQQVHIDYKNANLICDSTTNLYFEYLDAKAKECEELKIPYLVLHASKGENPPEINILQLNKMENLSKKHKNVYFCFENVRNNSNLEKILNLNQQNIKMCFDLGHAHAYGNEHELFNKFKDKIICSHLHNNFGKDEHNILTCGEIDYKPILNELIKIEDSSNCIEAFPHKDFKLTKIEFESFVRECFESLI